MKRIVIVWIRMAGICLVLASCNNFLEIDPPKNQLVSASIFKDEALAQGAVVGIYSEMIAGQTNNFASGGRNSVNNLMSLASDELVYNGSDVNCLAFSAANVQPSSAAVLTIWSSAYKAIFRANEVLEGLEAAENIAPETVLQLRGEALFIRAFCHFYLLNMFGNIPLVLTSDYRVTGTLKQAHETEVYESIENDLLNAADMLPDGYAFSQNERIRPNKWAAKALLARTYLYQQKWDLAVQSASTVISQTSLYTLEPVLNNVFIKNNPETIWEFLAMNNSYDTFEAAEAIPAPTSVTVPNYCLSAALLTQFDAADGRLTNWTGKFTPVNADETFLYPFKYKIRNVSGQVTHQEYSIVLRLSEQYLIRAEALAMLGDVSRAADDVNAVRQQHGKLPAFTTENADNLLLEIEHERQREFFYEWGHRWFDLKRWQKLDAVLSDFKTNWRPEFKLLPIPQGELDANSSLVQNTGY